MPLLAAIIGCQAVCLGGAAWLRPYTSAFLNVLEVACGGLDITTLVITLLVYSRTLAIRGEDLPAQADAYIKVGGRLLSGGNAERSPLGMWCQRCIAT